MNILFVTHFFPPERNEGTENYTLGLAQELSSRGHTVCVVCAADWHTGQHYWNGVSEDCYAGVPVYRIHLNWMQARNPNQVLYYSLPVEQWFDQLLASVQPDVVHVTSTYSLGIGVLLAAHRAGIPLVLTLMDFWFLCPRTVLMRTDHQLCDGQTTPWECQQCLLRSSNLFQRTRRVLPVALQPQVWRGIGQTPQLAQLRGVRGMALDMTERKASMQQALTLPNLILSHSRIVQDTFMRSDLAAPVLHLPNGHELHWMQHYKGKQDSPLVRFGYMGQIATTKGVHLLIEAFQHAFPTQRAQLDIWGDVTKDRPYVEHLQALIGKSANIRLHGRFERGQLAQVLAAIDVLVVPSIWYENAPLVIQEAFATQTPVIATNLGGMAEAITHDMNGLLFQREDVNDLAVQLCRIVEEPDLLARLRKGIAPVKTIQAEITEIEAIYQQLVSARPGEQATVSRGKLL